MSPIQTHSPQQPILPSLANWSMALWKRFFSVAFLGNNEVMLQSVFRIEGIHPDLDPWTFEKAFVEAGLVVDDART